MKQTFGDAARQLAEENTRLRELLRECAEIVSMTASTNARLNPAISDDYEVHYAPTGLKLKHCRQSAALVERIEQVLKGQP